MHRSSNALQRKLTPPNLPEAFLRRERLLLRLGEGKNPERKLTILEGAAGGGKTTLLVDYYGLTNGPKLFFSLSPSESDPVVFFRSLILALQRVLPSLPPDALEVVETMGNRGLTQAASLLCDELLEHLNAPLVLIIDNAQYLPCSKEAQAAFETLIRFFPDESQLILCGRSIPLPMLAQYRLRAQVVEVDDLDFTKIELACLLAAKTGAAPEELVQQVYERTQGWVTGIVYALEGDPDKLKKRLERPELLYAYLAEEVFDRLPGDFQERLLFASFLPSLDMEHCRPVMGGAEAFLEALALHRAFVTATEESLQFHPLFREFLQAEALGRWKGAERERHLVRLADAATTPEEEIRLLLLAEQWLEAEHRLVSSHLSLLQEGRTATVQMLTEAFPTPWLKKSAWLNYLEGEVARRTGHLNRALDALQTADSLCPEGQSNHPGPWIWASLSATHGARGDHEKQRAFAQKALKAAPEGSNALTAFCLNVLGLYHLAQTDLGSAKHDFQEALNLHRDADDMEGLTKALHNLGLTFATEGDFRCAIGFYQESIRQAEHGGRLPLPMTLNNLAVSHLYLGHLSEGGQAVEKGMALADRLASAREKIYLLWTMGQFHLHQELPLKARDCFMLSLEEAIRTGDHLSQFNAHLGLAETSIRQQDSPAAAAALEQAIALAGKPLEDPEMLEAALLRVEIEIITKQWPQALRVLAEIGANLSRIQNHYQAFHFERLSYRCSQATNLPQAAEAHWLKLQALSDRYGYPLPAKTESDAPPIMAAPPPALQVNSLGVFETKVDGLTVRSKDWRSGNAKVVLAYLLLNPNGVTKDQLVELLYPDDMPARSALHTVVARLRQALESNQEKGNASRFVFFQDGRYYVNRGLNIRFDVLEFQQTCLEAGNPSLSEDARKTLLLEAIRLYRGPFLEEFSDLTWCLIERERLRRLVIGAYEELFALLGKQDDWRSLESFADYLLHLEPCSESAYRAKMIALVMQDCREDALRVGQMGMQVLSSSLSQAPEPETTNLLELIRTERLSVRCAREFLSK